LIKPILECPVCSCTGFKSLFALKNADVVQCTDCELLYVPTPMPEVTSIYKASYFKGDQEVHGYGNYEEEYESHYKTFEHRIRETEMLMGGKGRVLDVGCALGHFGKVAKDRGWDVFVTDVSDFAVQKSAINYDLKGFVSSPDKLPVKPGEFDCITLFDVIEHVSQPLELLQNMHAALNKNGMLHLTTPNQKALSAKIMGQHWYHLKPEEHLLYFSPSTIQLALEKTGFEVVQIKPMATYMRVKDIFMRLRRYSKFFATVGLKVSQVLGLSEKIIKIYIGEMEIWARPKRAQDQNHLKVPRPVEVSQASVLDVVCCPNCKSTVHKDLTSKSEEILCTNCDSSYEMVAGVIDFSRYGKRNSRSRAI
jgi:2-polyprenyl-3-methyl-5-hydroxy-6-metoxy-1,4-benzoquinol methylase